MWHILQAIAERTSHRVCWVKRVDMPDTKVHLAKFYTGKNEDSEFDYFARQAALCTMVDHAGLPALEDVRLDHVQPLIVYSRLNAESLRHWINNRGQVPPHSQLIAIVRQIVEVVSEIHRTGFVHGQIHSDHVLVNHETQVHLIGLGRVELVGAITSQTGLCSFEPPEMRAGEFEVSTALDIYAIGCLMIELFGAHCAKWPIVRAMVSSNPDHRPTAEQLLWILRDLEHQLGLQDISANRRLAA